MTERKEPQARKSADDPITVGRDKLLCRLIEEHGYPRFDIPPELAARNFGPTDALPRS